MSRLTEIIAHKRKEIEPWLEHTDEWRGRTESLPAFRGFCAALTNNEFGFIGEIKKASPSAGVIAPEFDPAKIATIYDEADADCISVLTDEKYFLGHLDYLALVRTRVSRPLLRKDFTLHEVQIYQAALAGADAVLLIVSALTAEELKHLLEVSRNIGIDCLVEVHEEAELDRALGLGCEFIGINNRDLGTFELDLGVTERLAPKIPDQATVVSESGIRTEEDIRRVVAAGVDAALIGESLMRAPDPKALLQDFRRAANG
jgi:indole-3-glycerol phosphate synthase